MCGVAAELARAPHIGSDQFAHHGLRAENRHGLGCVLALCKQRNTKDDQGLRNDGSCRLTPVLRLYRHAFYLTCSGGPSLDAHNHSGESSSSRSSFSAWTNLLSRNLRAKSRPPSPKARANPSISAPKTMANATSTVCSANPSSSNVIEATRMTMSTRIVEL